MHQHTPPHDTEPLDDVDRLFARLAPASVPSGFTTSVLARTTGHASSGRVVWPWIAATCALVTTLVGVGYAFGSALAISDGLDLLEALSADFTLAISAPGDLWAALVEVIPWDLVLLAALCAGLMVWLASQLSGRVASTSGSRLAGPLHS